MTLQKILSRKTGHHIEFLDLQAFRDYGDLNIKKEMHHIIDFNVSVDHLYCGFPECKIIYLVWKALNICSISYVRISKAAAAEAV